VKRNQLWKLHSFVQHTFDVRAAQLEVALQTAPLTVLDDAELSTYGGVRIYLSTLAVTYSVRAEAIAS